MSAFDDLARFMSSPMGKMLVGIGRDAFNNHIYPALRDYMASSMKPVSPMSEAEQRKYAQEEFATVHDHDLDADAKEVPDSPDMDITTKI